MARTKQTAGGKIPGGRPPSPRLSQKQVHFVVKQPYKMAHSDEERYSAEEAMNEESESQNIVQSCSDDQEVEELIEE
ncbi:hypothetical protein R1sor_018642 [Riccia sorocarpa]|uniref:Uncharacterized protein n=1 Tax=Riccia sorocarpa TaxID=122646 RepID=A0ABD3IAA0_9MARC